MAIKAPEVHGAPGDGNEFFEFSRGTGCNGASYEPGEVASIPRSWAVVFAQQGRGRIVTAEELNAKAEAEAKAKADAETKAKADAEAKKK